MINGNCVFVTETNTAYHVKKWDLIIAHPPCTYLTVTGNKYFNIDKYGKKAEERIEKRREAAEFFMKFVNANCEHIAIENPIGFMSTLYRKPDQIIQPWQFALYDYENTVKSTCLWLKGLPKLAPYHVEKPEIKYRVFDSSGKRQSEWYYMTRCLGSKQRAKVASKTFPGIAFAMASQWGGILNV